MTAKQAGAKYGRTPEHINQIARQHGIRAHKAKTRLAGEALRKRNQAIITDLKGGMTAKQAGAKYGCTPEHINLIARQHGIRAHKAKTRLAGEALRKRNQAIIEDLKAGMTRKETGAKYDLDHSTISLIARQHGIHARRKPNAAM